jgi:hypothetical protein
MNARNSFLAASTGILLLGSAVQTASAQTVMYGTRNRPLEGRRYETMRALAHYLDESVQAAFNTAVEDARRGDSDRRLLPLVRDFARRADDFHSLMDNYEARPVDVPPRVNDLINRARRVTARLGTSYVADSTQEDWINVTDVLDRMKRLMAGENVQVPMAHGGFEDYDRDYGPFGDTYGGVERTGDTGGSRFGLRGYQLEQFRRLAGELDANALRSHQIAETNRANYTDRQEEFLLDLRRFAERAHDVHLRADAATVNPREIGPIVNQLRQDARDTDRSLRETRVFPQVWDQWSRTIDVLDRMADLVRY